MPWGRRYTKKVRSLTPNFRKKRVSCFWGQITHIRKSRFCRCFCCRISEAGWTPEKKWHLESGLNQRDRAMAGLIRVRSHRKPSKVFYQVLYCRGFAIAKGMAWAGLLLCTSSSERERERRETRHESELKRTWRGLINHTPVMSGALWLARVRGMAAAALLI